MNFLSQRGDSRRRRQPREARSVTKSAVPVLRTEDFTSQGSTDLANQLRAVVPSFNVSIQPISDAATIVRPANLRNLAPDHTLILVNGKRRHRAAVITGSATVSRTARRDRTSPSSPRLQSGRPRCCATGRRRNTARTPSPAS